MLHYQLLLVVSVECRQTQALIYACTSCAHMPIEDLIGLSVVNVE